MSEASLRRVHAIEGIRGVLSVIVVAGHVNANLALWFWGCMEVFFAISGYLIGTISLRYRDSPNFWRTYLARRALRIWPLYFVVLSFCVGADLIRAAYFGDSTVGIGLGTLRDVFFLQNTEMYGQRFPEPSLVGGGYPSMFHHSWSVAIEEQFYLFAPWLTWAVVAGVRRLNGSRMRLAAGIAAVLIICVGIRALGISWWVLLGRLDAFVLGVLVACLLERSDRGGLVPQVPMIRRAFLACSVAAAGFALSYYVPDTYVYSLNSQYQWRHYLGVVVFALFGAALVAACVTRSFPRLLAPLGWRALQFLGKISYSTYLWHVPILLILKDLAWYRDEIPMGFHLPALFAIVLLASTISFHLIELPFIRFKPRFMPPMVDVPQPVHFRTG